MQIIMCSGKKGVDYFQEIWHLYLTPLYW